MGLINYQKADATSAEFVHHMAVLKAFGRGDHDSGAAVQLGKQFSSDVNSLSTAEAYAVYSCPAKSGDLIVHQSQKRVDNDRDALAYYGRQQEA